MDNGYKEELQNINGVEVKITTYKIGEDFYCHIYNTDPGATIARASGNTRQEALQRALEKARKRIK